MKIEQLKSYCCMEQDRGARLVANIAVADNRFYSQNTLISGNKARCGDIDMSKGNN